MAKYRVRDRDTVVDAFQFTEAVASTPDQWPAWLGSGALYGQAIPFDAWVIRDAKGQLSLQTPDVFPQFYTEVAP